MDRVASSTDLLETAREFLAQELQKAAGQLRESQDQQQRLQVELKNNLAAIQAQVPNADNSLDNLSSARQEIEKLRRGLEDLTRKLRQQELALLQSNVAAQRDAELRVRLEQSRRVTAPWIPDLLREAVASGKARPVE